MFKILFFAIKRQFLSNFKKIESILGFATQLIFGLFLIGTGVGLAHAFEIFGEENASIFKIGLLIAYSNAIITYAFFPDYKNRSRLISKMHPFLAWQRWIVNISFDFFDFITISIVGMFITLNLFSKVFTNFDLVFFLMFLFNIKIGVYILKTIVEEIHALKYLKWIWVGLVVIFLSIVISQGLNSMLSTIALSITFFIQLALSITFEKHYVGLSSSKFSFDLFKNMPFPAIYWAFLKSTKSRKAYLLSIIMKITFLILTCNFDFGKMMSGNFILFIYITPLSIFTYFGNNLWGFYPEIWLNTIIRKPSEALITFFKILLIPIVLDFMAMSIILVIGQKLTLSIILYYFSTLLLLFLNAYIFSHQKPINVGEGVSFSQTKPKVNGWSAFLSIVLIGIASLFQDYIWISVGVIFLGLLIFYYIQKEFRNDKNLNYAIFDGIKE